MKVFGAEKSIDISTENFKEDEIKKLEDSMPECKHGWFDSVYEKASLHYRAWLPKDKPKAIVVYMHGIQTHGGKSAEIDGRKLNAGLMAETFLKQGYALYAYDLYGHGYSEGKRSYVPNGEYQVNQQDYVNFINLAASKHDEGTPIFLIGESYGGNLTIHVAKQFQDNPSSGPSGFKGIVLTGPAIVAPDLPPYPVYLLLRYILAPIWPEWIPFFMPNPVSPDRIWEDPKVLAMRTDPSYVALKVDGSGIPFRLGTAVAMLVALADACKNAIPGFTVPYCILHGTKDYATPIAGSELMWEKAATPEADKEFHKIEGAYHDLLSGFKAEDCLNKMVSFMEKQLSKQS